MSDARYCCTNKSRTIFIEWLLNFYSVKINWPGELNPERSGFKLDLVQWDDGELEDIVNFTFSLFTYPRFFPFF